MDYRQKILSLVKTSPVLPAQVAKSLGIDSLMAGAMLSEMVSKGMLKVSKLKVGGSPVYFAPENASQLKNFVGNLNEKDQRTVMLLEEKGVLREKDQDPLVRVSLQNIKDFSAPLTVAYDDKEELFYKWYLLSDEDAERKIRLLLEPKKEEKAPVVDERVKESEAVMKETPISRPKRTACRKDQSDFFPVIEDFFRENNISIVEKNVLKKDDVEFVVGLPSPVGQLSYFCKVKGKKRISDADLSSAYVQGQLKKLPVMLLTRGELTKSAKELLPKLKGLVVKRL